MPSQPRHPVPLALLTARSSRSGARSARIHEPPPHPRQVLRRFHLRARHIQQLELARRIAIDPGEISRLLNARRDVSPRLAWKLAAALETTPGYWMLLQMDYDLWRTRPQKHIKPFPLAPRRRRVSRSRLHPR